jgi:hypothetical protein
MVFESNSVEDPLLRHDPTAVEDSPEPPAAPPQPIVPMKLPTAEPTIPEVDPDPGYSPFPGYCRFPAEEITRQMQLLC